MTEAKSPRGLVADRAVLRLSGAETRPFLQDLVTNDVAGIDSGPVYAALLTPQGKYLFDFFLVADPEDPEAALIDVAADRAGALAQRLAMYRLRRKVAIGEAGLGVALVWGEGWREVPGALPDPRHEALGGRVYAADPAAALAGVAPAAPEARAALRVRHGVPASGVDLIPDDSYVLEAGFERLHGVDFRKGCYVGQEIVARMKHKTALRKGLARVAIDGEAAPGAALLAEDGKPAGVLGSVAGDRGLAHLRFDRAGGVMRAGDAVVKRID